MPILLQSVDGSNIDQHFRKGRENGIPRVPARHNVHEVEIIVKIVKKNAKNMECNALFPIGR